MSARRVERARRLADELRPAAAVDALSEIAASGGLPSPLLLRPQAPTSPAARPVFWDDAPAPELGNRSANSVFSVRALTSEWVDELTTAGFASVTGIAVLDDSSIGVVLQGMAPVEAASADVTKADTIDLRWEGDSCATGHALQHLLQGGQSPSAHNEAGRATDIGTTSGVAWMVDASRYEASPVAYLGALLARLAALCRALAAEPGRWWVILGLTTHDDGDSPAAHPLWCAIAAALRVAQNEYPDLDIRCLGVANDDAASLAAAAEEIAAATEEREICFQAGQRFVFRVERGVAASITPRRPEADRLLKLVARSGSGGSGSAGRGALAWTEAIRTPAGPGEVEIEVAATGLNFRDVMWNLGLLPEEALEDGYAGTRLGMECAGTISAVGPEVTGLAIGDRVVGFVSGGFASHVIAPAFAVSPLPGPLSLEAAATVPVAFLTAYYSLCTSLTGPWRRCWCMAVPAVGSSLQVARHCGAKVIATAGSEEKRALLRELGAETVLNSRTLVFADEVAALTNGKGVDVVLNSLAGEAMVRSMDCLRPFGRFVELGKRDFYANTQVGLRPFRRNLSYFGVDVDQLIGEHKALTRAMFSELIALFASGQLSPLPHREFRGQHIEDAFRLMQRSGHIGKILVRPAERTTADTRQTGRFPVDAEGLHIVFGGTSGFGLATAAWLVRRGARHLVLASRSGRIAPGAEAELEALRELGADILVKPIDVADEAGLEAFLRGAAQSRPIRGIVHAAMVLDDRLIDGLDRKSLETVLRPKMMGALALDRLTSGDDLDYFLPYSSATTLLGNPGQYH